MSESGRLSPQPTAEQQNARVDDMATSYKSILERVGEDPSRQGLLKTPERAAKALMYFTKGYEENIAGKLIIGTIKLLGVEIILHVARSAQIIKVLIRLL